MATQEIRGYCSQCSCYCRIVSYVRDGVFVDVKPDKAHPLYSPICPKGKAGPELVYNSQRLQYPMRRTTPKGSPDPGWQRISWDEALDTIATKLNEIKAQYGAEAVATSRAGPGGSALSEIWPWLKRFAQAFGTPNNISTTHICQWHRDNCSAYTYGKPGVMGTHGRAEFERAGSILILGNNVPVTRLSMMPFIERGMKHGAKLVVIDTRKTDLAAKADLWLQVNPDTDTALFMSMLHVMLEENLHDAAFARDWTTGPFLVRSDTGNLLKASDLAAGGNSAHYVVAGPDGNTNVYQPGAPLPIAPVLDTACTVNLAGGQQVECKTAFRLLRESVAEYTADRAAAITGVPASKIRDAVKILTTRKPACWYSWNGIEQSRNASQTNRALCLFYALTGDYDKPGGNVLPPGAPLNPIVGAEFLTPEARQKCLGYQKRPLGPAGTSQETQGYEVYEAILTGKPYPVKALLGFGGNMILSNAPIPVAKEALSKLDLHVQCDMFLTPTATLADIVLPAASSWECWHIGTNIASLGDKAHIQMRPAVVPPQHESWPDMKVIFELAKRLGLGDKFWNGDIDAAFNYMLAPSHITVEQLRQNPAGLAVDLSMKYQKYAQKDPAGNFTGFPTPSKRIEIYQQVFKDLGYDPLPTWRPSLADVFNNYPLTLTGGKVVEFCHSQHRALPSLRKRVPHPFLEINPVKARELDIKNGEWIILETPYGSITLTAKLTEGILPNVVCTQNGWWQACPELNLPGYDAFSSAGANVNMLYRTEDKDPLSGSLAIKGCPCRVKKKT